MGRVLRGPDAPARDCSFFPGVGTDGVYTSSDGGTTWVNRGLIDEQPSWAAAGVVSDGDPVLADGRVPGPTGSRGRTAPAPTTPAWPRWWGPRASSTSWSATPTTTGRRGPRRDRQDEDECRRLQRQELDRRRRLSVQPVLRPPVRHLDRVPFGHRHRQRQRAGHGRRLDRRRGHLRLARNSSSPAGNNRTGNGRQGSSSLGGPDGTVYVAFEQGSTQVVPVSRDGGTSWTRPAPVGPVVDIADPIPGANFRTDSFPRPGRRSAAGSTTSPPRGRRGPPPVGASSCSTSTDRAAHWSSPVHGQRERGLRLLPRSGRRPERPRRSRLPGARPPPIRPRSARPTRSIDAWAVTKPAGGTWSTPTRISTVSSDPAASAKNNLQRQFWGDYNTVVSGADRGVVHLHRQP